MKALFLVIFLLAQAGLYAQEKLTPQESESIQTLTTSDFVAKAHDLVGSVIKLKFNVRLQRFMDSKYYPDSQFAAVQTQTAKESTFVSVLFNKSGQGASWFSKVSTDVNSKKICVIVGRIVEEHGDQPYLKAMGTDIQTNIDGTEAVWPSP